MQYLAVAALFAAVAVNAQGPVPKSLTPGAACSPNTSYCIAVNTPIILRCNNGTLQAGNCDDNLDEPKFGAICETISLDTGIAQCVALTGPSGSTTLATSTVSASSTSSGSASVSTSSSSAVTVVVSTTTCTTTTSSAAVVITTTAHPTTTASVSSAVHTSSTVAPAGNGTVTSTHPTAPAATGAANMMAVSGMTAALIAGLAGVMAMF